MKGKILKLASLIMAVVAIMVCMVVSTSAIEEETAIDKLVEFINSNDDVVEFYLNSDNYTQKYTLSSSEARCYRVYSTDDYDMYLKVVKMYNLYYAAALDIVVFDYDTKITSSSTFDAWNTYTLSIEIQNILLDKGIDSSQASISTAICLGSNGTANPTRSVSSNPDVEKTELSYVGSIITTTDIQGYIDYVAQTGEDYGRVYSFDYYQPYLSQEIDGVTYYIRYFTADSMSLSVIKSIDDVNEWIVSFDSNVAGTYQVIVAALSSIGTETYEVEGGNLYFEIDYDTFNVTLADADSTITAATIPAKINNIEVSEILEYAFYHCEELTSLVIPETIKIIGNSAFRSCTSLTSIKILGDVQTINKFTFAYCSSLQYVVISGDVQEIGYKAFSSCTDLKSITLPSTITSIDETAFYNLDALETIYFGGSEKDWTALNAVIDETVTVIFNHVCSDVDGDGCCDECEFEIVIDDTQDDESTSNSSLNSFESFIEMIKITLADLISIIKNIFKFNIF